MIAENNMETVIDAMAEKIRRLEADVFMKDFEIGDLKRRIADLDGDEAQK